MTYTHNLFIAPVKDLVKRSGEEKVKKCKFNIEKGPSDEWFRAFEKRHKNLKWCVPQTKDSKRLAQSDEYVLDHFFNFYGIWL